MYMNLPALQRDGFLDNISSRLSKFLRVQAEHQTQPKRLQRLQTCFSEFWCGNTETLIILIIFSGLSLFDLFGLCNKSSLGHMDAADQYLTETNGRSGRSCQVWPHWVSQTHVRIRTCFPSVLYSRILDRVAVEESLCRLDSLGLDTFEVQRAPTSPIKLPCISSNSTWWFSNGYPINPEYIFIGIQR